MSRGILTPLGARRGILTPLARSRAPLEADPLDLLSDYWLPKNRDGSGHITGSIAGKVLTNPGGSNAMLTLGAGLSDKVVYLPGVAGAYISRPHAASLNITGDIDLRLSLALTDWTPGAEQTLLAKRRTGSGGEQQYALTLLTDGKLRLDLSETTSSVTTASSSVATGVSDGARKWVRATWRQSDGRVQFFLSDDGSSWSQLGSDGTISISSIASGSSVPLVVGCRLDDTTTARETQGYFYEAQLYDGIDDTLVASLSASSFSEPYSTASDGVSGTWTIQQPSSGASVQVIDPANQGHGLLGFTDDYAYWDDTGDYFDRGVGEDLTWVLVVRIPRIPAANQLLLSKKADLTTAAGHAVYLDTSGRVNFVLADGTNSVTLQSAALTVGQTYVIGAIRDGGTARLALDGTQVDSDTDPTGDLSNALDARIFRLGSTGTSYADGLFLTGGVALSALSASDTGSVGAALLAANVE